MVAYFSLARLQRSSYSLCGSFPPKSILYSSRSLLGTAAQLALHNSMPRDMVVSILFAGSYPRKGKSKWREFTPNPMFNISSSIHCLAAHFDRQSSSDQVFSPSHFTTDKSLTNYKYKNLGFSPESLILTPSTEYHLTLNTSVWFQIVSKRESFFFRDMNPFSITTDSTQT